MKFESIQHFSFKKMQLKMSSVNWQRVCLGLNVSKTAWCIIDGVYLTVVQIKKIIQRTHNDSRSISTLLVLKPEYSRKTINIILAEALAACVTKPLAAMALMIQDERTYPCPQQGKIFTTCITSVLTNDRKCCYISMFPSTNSAQLGLSLM